MKNKLRAKQVENAGPGKLYDGGGLYLQKQATAGSWIFRYSHLKRRREMGLGSWPEVSLSMARQRRDEAQQLLTDGKDPIEVRNAERLAEKQHRDRTDPTLAEAAEMVLEARKARLRDGGKRGQWMNPLQNHVLPKIGRIRISELHQSDIHGALKPIWRTKHPTAKKCIMRLRIILDEMEVMGFDCDPRMIRAAKRMLGDHHHKEKQIPATPWQAIPDLFARLDSGSSVDQCLRMMILCLARVHAVRGAEFSEIEGDVWTVPADRVKGREHHVKDFRIPITGPMQEIIETARGFDDTYLFPSYTGKVISDAALEKRLRTMKEVGQPHGFRTSFKTWAQDTDACSWEVSETILGHAIGTKVERAYARSDLLERRRIAMEAWADHVTGKASADVINLR